MLKPSITVSKERGAAFLAALGSLMSGTVLAALPTPVAPTTAPTAGNWLEFVSYYFDDAITAIGLILAGSAFIWVAWTLIAKFNEARSGKAEWGEIGLLVLAGGSIIVFIVYMVNEASLVII